MGTRTTLTLDPDVAQRVQQFMERESLTFKDALNKVLRLGLDGLEQTPPRKPFKVKPFVISGPAGLQPGMSWERLSQEAEHLEDLETARKLGLAK